MGGSEDDPFAGDAKSAHAARHAEFADWLIDTFGSEALSAGGGVLDIAGGRGDLAFELHCRRQIPTTLIEPREVSLDRRKRKMLRKSGSARFQHVRTMLDSAFDATDEGAALLASCSCMVGMHADEATESIVDMALRHGRPFAVVPCCVFPRLFPSRRLASGQPVVSHRHFCDYLLAKSAPGEIEVAFLPFEGRNRVLYRRQPRPPQPGRAVACAIEAYVPQSVRRQQNVHEADAA